MECNILIIISLLYLSFIFSSKTAVAIDTISPKQTLRDGDTISSSGGSFELGFFSPGKSRFRYLGIWYKKIATGTVVWVANRDTPLTNSSGSLKLDLKSGSLVLLREDDIVVWSSSSNSMKSSSSGNVIVQLLDSGNLVIRNENSRDPENYLWQSFDHPGNTFLPGMKIGIVSPGLSLKLTAWTSPDDPSPSGYQLQVDSSGLQLVIKQSAATVSRSGVWNGIRFNGLTYLRPNPIFSYNFVYTQKERYYTYQMIDNSILTRLILSDTGVVQRYTWNERAESWNLFLAVPVDYCDTYALCGPYGSCDISNTPVCGCLKGFEPQNLEEWERADWKSGCMRKTKLNCGKGDGFKKYDNVKLPDMIDYAMNESMSLEECEVMCLSNCSCMAYANSNVSGTVGSGCFMWFGDLIDIKQFPEDGQDVYIRVAASEIGRSSKRRKVKIILISVFSANVSLLLVGLAFIVWKKRKLQAGPREIVENNAEEDPSKNDKNDDLDLPHFDLATIARATNNFSPQNMLGEGGFGPVYKGLLEQQEIAVKRLSKESKQGQYEFKNEVKCIAGLQHRNLVKLLGYCIQREERILVYEYMPNKSLDYYVLDQRQSKLLDWSRRFHIINGIARGLLYLHQDSRLRVIHRDLKLSNILLDSELNPRISDFGMARIFGGDETSANTRRIVGTYGYMSPEYTIDGVFSIKSDVFSFGVLVLEIISGRRNRGFVHSGHQLNLIGHAWVLFNEGRYMELIDGCVEKSSNPYQVLRSIHVGLLCVQHNPEDRPTMSSVLLMLAGEGRLPLPKEPGFFQERKLIDTDTSSSNQDSCSINEVTLSLIQSR